MDPLTLLQALATLLINHQRSQSRAMPPPKVSPKSKGIIPQAQAAPNPFPNDSYVSPITFSGNFEPRGYVPFPQTAAQQAINNQILGIQPQPTSTPFPTVQPRGIQMRPVATPTPMPIQNNLPRINPSPNGNSQGFYPQSTPTPKPNANAQRRSVRR